MKIAVTGATGFIGQHVVAEMEQRSLSPILMCQPSVEIPASVLKHSIVLMDLREPPVNTFNMSGGEQLRDYLPVTEVARYLVHLAMTNKNNGIVNICSGKPVSVRKLVENWIKENGWTIALNLGYYPYPDYEPMAFWGCADKLSIVIEGTALR